MTLKACVAEACSKLVPEPQGQTMFGRVKNDSFSNALRVVAKILRDMADTSLDIERFKRDPAAALRGVARMLEDVADGK